MNREHVRRYHPSADDVLGRDAAVSHKTENESRAGQIDQFVDGTRRDQFMTQAMGADVGEFGQRRREVWLQETSDQVRIVNQHRRFKPLDEIDLGVRRGQRELGPREAGVPRMALVQRFARRYRGLHPGENSAIGDGLKMIAKLGQMRAAAELFETQRQDLVAIVGDNAAGDFVGACGERVVARVEGELAAGHGGLEQNLQIDFVIRHVDTGRIVDRVGVDAPAGERVLDASPLRETQVAALDYYPGAKLGRSDSACVVGVVGDFGVGLASRANVGADAAVVKEIDRRAQDALNQGLAVERVGIAAERGARLRSSARFVSVRGGRRRRRG